MASFRMALNLRYTKVTRESLVSVFTQLPILDCTRYEDNAAVWESNEDNQYDISCACIKTHNIVFFLNVIYIYIYRERESHVYAYVYIYI